MKKNKITHIIYLFFIGIITFVFVISALLTALVRSNIGREKIKSYAIKFAQKNNVHLQLEEVKGNFPLQIILKNCEAILPNEQIIKVENLSFRVSFLGLLKNKLIFKSFNANEIYISSLPKELSLDQKITKEISGFTLPLKISFKKVTLQNIHIQNLLFDASGKLDLEKGLNAFSCNLKLTKKEFEEQFINITARANKKLNLVNVDLKVESNNLALLKPWIDSDKKIKISFTINSKSKWKDLENLLSRNISENISLSRGKIVGYIYPKDFNNYNFTQVDIDSNFELYSDLSAALENLSLSNNFIRANGQAYFQEKLALDKIALSFNTTDLSLFNDLIKTKLNGTFEGAIIGSTNGMSLNYRTKNLSIGKYPVSVFEGSLFSKLNDRTLSGQISSNIVTLGEAVSFFSNFSYKYTSSLNLKQISIHAPSFDLTSDLQITPDLLFLGYTQANFNNLNILKEFIKRFDFNATAGGMLHLFAKEGKQDFDANILFYDYHIDDLIGEKVTLEIKAKDIFNNPKFNFHTQASNIRFNRLKIESLEFNTSNRENNNEYQLSLFGKWRNPLEIKSKGFWNKSDDKINLNIQSIDGFLLNQPYSLTSPSNAILKKDYFFLNGFEITTPTSSINAQIELGEKNSDIRIVATHFPIDFLSFNPLEVSVYGYSSAELSVSEKNSVVEGNVNINVDEITLASISDETPMKAKGYFSAIIENEKLKVKGKIQAIEKESFLEIETMLPIVLNLMPFNFKIKKEEPLNAEIALKGTIEEFLDFINVGNQRLEGEIGCNISISDSFSSPNLQGYCKIANGGYENYVTGTTFKDINCEFSSNNYELTLKYLSASDSKKGGISATGKIDLRESIDYPFTLDLHLNNILVFQTALVDASMKGDINVKGDKKEAFASGNIDVTNAELTIPDKIPIPMPQIDVTFLNKAITKPQMIKEKNPPYPINLDINLHSTENIFIKGKGVDAQLKGEVKLKGTNTDMIPDGRLELIKGAYLFAGKYFDLSESTIVFTGAHKALPIISIGAKTLQSGVLITASLKGDLNAPEISFSSSPPLPLSSIISLLIFGHDLSGISALQALQIATIVAALSEGGSLLETTKRNLGIDRLAVVSKAGETAEDPDQIAVEVGKYITRGLLVSYRQGVEDGMSNASAELDIGWGFIFQIETIREEEQTRATLKWSHNF